VPAEALRSGRPRRRPERYDGPSGQISPTPVRPLSVSMTSTVLSNAAKLWLDQM
jgi:hypothetical protein